VTTIVGFILGYAFAWKVGTLEMDKINTAWSDIRKSEFTRSYVGGASVVAGALLRQALFNLVNEPKSRRRR